MPWTGRARRMTCRGSLLLPCGSKPPLGPYSFRPPSTARWLNSLKLSMMCCRSGGGALLRSSEGGSMQGEVWRAQHASHSSTSPCLCLGGGGLLCLHTPEGSRDAALRHLRLERQGACLVGLLVEGGNFSMVQHWDWCCAQERMQPHSSCTTSQHPPCQMSLTQGTLPAPECMWLLATRVLSH